MEEREVRFFGKITAGFTHEMKNVLAIIRESAGLMEDLLLMQQAAPCPHQERFTRALSTIGAQVRRGIELSSNLNRFAHSPDEPTAILDLNDIMAQVTLLAERFARLKGVKLLVEETVETCTLVSSPVKLQMAAFEALQCLWNRMNPGGEVSCSIRRLGDSHAVVMQCRDDLAHFPEFSATVTNSEEWAALREVVASLDGRLELDIPGSSFLMVLPKARE